MANNELTKSKASSKIEESLIKLTFLSDVISFWDSKNPFTSEQQYGFALCMEDAIKEIEKCASVLEDCK